jgi:hypothetical protein
MSNEIEKNRTTLETKDNFLEFDKDHESYQDLIAYGSRISTLLNDPKIRSNNEAVILLDDLLGAVYALVLAEHNLFQDRTGNPIENPAVYKRAEQLGNGDLRLDGKWIAGWHFNSALYRIASVYHRLLKLIRNSNSRDYVNAFVQPVKNDFEQWTGAPWSNAHTDVIHEQVNTIKHQPGGIYDARTATRADAKGSINELLDLIEAWSTATAAAN